MRILFLIDNLRPGGAQKALLAICRALLNSGAEAEVWCLGGTSEIEEGFRALGVPVLGGRGAFWRTLFGPLALVRHLRRRRVDLMQTLLFHSDVTGRIAGRLARVGRGRPVIVSSVRASNVRNRWWQFALLRLTAPLADAFTAVSTRTLEFAAAREGVDARRATVIPNGIDLAEWTPLPDAAEARAALRLRPEDFVIGTLGRLHEQKGHAFLLEAAARVLAQAPETFFLIAGYGPLRERLEAQAAALGIAPRVRFLGYRRDAPALLAAMDLFALPSLWEGMSNAVLEAMAAARPVVATAVDGALEQVAHGETGLLVPPSDADALAEAILSLARDRQRAREMGMRGRERAGREFSMERSTHATMGLYRRILGEAAPETLPAHDG